MRQCVPHDHRINRLSHQPVLCLVLYSGIHKTSLSYGSDSHKEVATSPIFSVSPLYQISHSLRSIQHRYNLPIVCRGLGHLSRTIGCPSLYECRARIPCDIEGVWSYLSSTHLRTRRKLPHLSSPPAHSPVLRADAAIHRVLLEKDAEDDLKFLSRLPSVTIPPKKQ